MVYLVPADLRTATARFPGLVVSTSEASDARLTTVIAEMSSYFDRMADDHYEPTNATTFIYDGPAPDAYGRGGTWLSLNRRIRAVSSIALIGADGTSQIPLPAISYRVHSSLVEATLADTIYGAEFGPDAIELLGQGDRSLTGAGSFAGYWTWPTWPRSIAITGNWDWAAPPEMVVEAVAMLVVAMLRTRAVPPGTTGAKVASYSSGRVTFAVGEDKGGSGIPLVDQAIGVYGRALSAIEVV